MKPDLFHEFDPVSSKQWKQKIQADLKGADYNETLLWKTNEGITVKPFYHGDEYDTLPLKPEKKRFHNCQQVFVDDASIADKLAKDALARGANSILFEADKPFDIDDLKSSLAVPSLAEIHFKLNFLSGEYLSELVGKTAGKKVFLNVDPLGNLANTGNWFHDMTKDHQVLESILHSADKSVSVLAVNVSGYQNAGANSIQQIAYALAHANEYLNFIEDKKIPVGLINFQFSVGGNYFFEIAKLQAFRYLWDLLKVEYRMGAEAYLFVQPSLRNKTLYDFNVNMLRTTTECMSAILGGADTISNTSYDTLFHKKNEFGERIARNQLLIISEESYFKEAVDAASGSYYIETLAKQMADKALELFKDIERSGGFLKQLIEGTIQRKIEESATKEQMQFDAGEFVLVGTNKYPNPADKMKAELELYPFIKTKPRKTIIEPIIARRLAEKMEQERLENE